MLDGDAAGRPALLAHRPQQIGAGRGERMRRLGGDGGGQFIGGREASRRLRR